MLLTRNDFNHEGTKTTKVLEEIFVQKLLAFFVFSCFRGCICFWGQALNASTAFEGEVLPSGHPS